jgi:hypothetical protein
MLRSGGERFAHRQQRSSTLEPTEVEAADLGVPAML